MRPLLLSAAFLAFAVPTSAGAQNLRAVGLFGGAVESHQVRTRGGNSDARTGIVGGAFLDAQLGPGMWSVLAEGGYVERGGSYPGVDGGEVEADYLAVTVAPSWHFDVGFVGAFAYGGPTLEVSLRNRSTVTLSAAYMDPASQVFSVTAGGGVELRIPSTFGFRLEVRHVEGLSPAFRNDGGDFKHRSTEILVRVGRRGA